MRVQSPLPLHPVTALLFVAAAAAAAAARASTTTSSSTCSPPKPRACACFAPLASSASAHGDVTKKPLRGTPSTSSTSSLLGRIEPPPDAGADDDEDDGEGGRGGGGAQFPPPPLLAVLTEPDAVSTEGRLVETAKSLRSAIIGVGADEAEDDEEGHDDGTPHLVSVRVALTDDDEDRRREEVGRVMRLVRGLRGWCRHGKKSSAAAAAADRGFVPLVVINAGDAEVSADTAVSCNDADGADDNFIDVGVHVKERDLESIPSIRAKLSKAHARASRKGAAMMPPVIGASVHSVPSAVRAAELGVDYLIVGTCYPTPSHPEKSGADEVEGPDLPGLIGGELIARARGRGPGAAVRGDVAGGGRRGAPRVFGIGGIDAGNCADVIGRGADGVAVMRGVLGADDPGKACRGLRMAMGGAAGHAAGELDGDR